MVILAARSSPATTQTGSPEPLDQAGVVGRGGRLVVGAGANAACARRSSSRVNPCGVCTARRSARGTVASTGSTAPPGRTCLTCRSTGRPGTTAAWPASTASITRAISDGGASGRAASCTRTTSISSDPGPDRAPRARQRPSLPRRPAGHDPHEPRRSRLERRGHGRDVLGGCGDHQRPDMLIARRTRRQQVPGSVHDERLTPQRHQAFGRE